MRVLVTGASGQLGAYLLRAAPACRLTAWSHSTGGELRGIPLIPVDLADGEAVARAFKDAAPEIVIHAAAISRIDRCYQDPQLAERINAGATSQLCELAADSHARLLYISTDMVFDGDKGSPYTEADNAEPKSQYGRSKLRGESFAAGLSRGAVARISLLVGPALHHRESFFDAQMRSLREGRPLDLFIDEWRTPLDYPTAAEALWALALSDAAGIYHVGGPERLSRWDIGRQLAEMLNADRSLIRRFTQDQVPTPEPRPKDLSLDSSHWRSHFPRVPWRPWIETVRQLLATNQG